MKQSERIEQFVTEIWHWFDQHKRELPWRDLDIDDDTQRAYQVLVSEIMLQQTQVPRVRIKYREFLEAFPTVYDLANASNADVIMAWRGLGYNSRALRLRDAAKIITLEYNGVFPKEMNELLSIKGIGAYTAGAVRNFAFCLPTPCIDTNIRRILHRVFYGPEDKYGEWKKSDKQLLMLAEDVLATALSKDANKKRTSADWHAALMDFGSIVCTKTNPKWDMCPLTRKGICKASYKVPKLEKKQKKEPGRLMGSTFIPNRIFRGKIIEELRDDPNGVDLESLGKRVCLDWSDDLKDWLDSILQALKRDDLVKLQNNKYYLR